uniref:Uncharacterized protein n=1 Tax=Panagrolaimus sp. PS1159 TaxID=55785 RepID=A0AC35EV75_9BILA
MMSGKNCPICRTNAFQSDIIKLFIQENNIEIPILKKEEILPYIETKYDGFCQRIIKECKCEIFQYETGKLQYKCLKDFDINICSYEKTGNIQIIFPNEIIVKTFQSKRLDIIRGKTNEKSIVDSNGKRFEHFYQGMRNGIKEFLVKTPNKGFFRSNDDFVRQDVNRIKFCFSKFTIKRSLKNEENGKIIIRVFTNDPKKSLKIQICPEHQSFFIEHFFEIKITRCTNSGFLCNHLNE